MKFEKLDVQFEKRGHVFRIAEYPDSNFKFISVDGGEKKIDGRYDAKLRSFRTNYPFTIDGRQVNSIGLPDEIIAEIEKIAAHNEECLKWRREKPFRDALAKAIETGERVAYSDYTEDITGYVRTVQYVYPDGTKKTEKTRGY